MSTQSLADQVHRQQALDITDSFIVQAPAGSGKTELLTLRFLKLLATCEEPEQVLAITFTKKAANEMGKRIIDALRWTQECQRTGTAAKNDLDSQRLEIANAVLAQDNKYNWHLMENPARLRVQTIDSFCFYLANQLPVLSQLGGNPKVSEDVTMCFIDAVSKTLAQLETEQPISDDIAALMGHLDNDVNKVERLLVNLLYKRDQWLPHILDIKRSFTDAQTYLQLSLGELVEESLVAAHAGLQHYTTELVPLLNFAAANLPEIEEFPTSDFIPLTTLPAADFTAMPYWNFLVNALLTKSESTKAPAWRRMVNVKNGFPPGDKTDKAHAALCKSQKESMHSLLKSLADDNDLLNTLDYLRMLPDPALDGAQWQFLAALTRVLAHLSTELLLAFHKYRVIDYTQTSSAARAALGEDGAPTDLALALDHRIQHVLVDEFQDTSQMQLDILQQITAGWEPDDGRTLFLVGDAMQSCYAFRNANVGIYLNVRAHGLRNISLTPLTLQTNFRSQAHVVDWVNRVFASAFPQQANISRGAVPYTESVAKHGALANLNVQVTLLSHDRDQQTSAQQLEAIRVVDRVESLQKQFPDQTIAILVRARPHLSHIIPALREAGIHWQSTDIDPLTTLPVIEDMISLTRSILNQTDRLAWLALLRAPWCGLGINDLHAITSHASQRSIWLALQELDDIAQLSADARERLQGIYPILQFAMQNRYRISLRTLLENCWHLLEGISIASSQIELDSVMQYLNLVSEQEIGGGIPDIDQFCESVAAAFVPNRAQQNSSSQAQVHLLTMHKAKGLEFDHVLLPGLARKPRSDDKQLLQWHQRINADGDSRLFLATLSASGADDAALYRLLRYEQKYKTTLENTRLLYIATTRARASVQLIATLPRNSKGEMLPPAASLLNCIWRELRAQPELLQEIEIPAASSPATGLSSDYPNPTPIRRLQQPLRVSATQKIHLLQWAGTAPDSAQEDFSLQDDATVGTLVHQTLEAIGRSGDFTLDAARLQQLRPAWRLRLHRITANAAELDALAQLIEAAVVQTLGKPELHWLFTAELLAENEFEVALSRRHEGVLHNYLIDRSFIDTAGTRWIIDYKTAMPAASQSQADFLAEQKALHSAQLINYRDLFAQLDARPIKCALLFTGTGTLVELNDCS